MTKLATISLTATSDKAQNIKQAFDWMQKAADGGADWVLLPEIFAFHGSYQSIYDMAESDDGPLNTELARFAEKHGVILFAGSVGERPTAKDLETLVVNNTLIANEAKHHRRVFNTSYVFGRRGELLAKYRKTHLFNLRDADGKALYCESDGFIPGSGHTTLSIDGYRCGLSICYDLRFPRFFQKLAENAPLDVLIIPSAFTKKTGEAHWELLLRARSVELQCYVYSANQTGTHSAGKESFGHSMIIDPWGIKLCDTGGEPGVAFADISRERIAEVRAQLPALQNSRPELY